MVINSLHIYLIIQILKTVPESLKAMLLIHINEDFDSKILTGFYIIIFIIQFEFKYN
jgi:hypothetical protein